MSQFNSKFDLVTEETFAAPAAVAVMLDAPTNPTYAGGTWQNSATVLKAGTIVKIDSTGKAAKASSPTLIAQNASTQVITLVAPVLPLVVIDGNDTFSGAFTGKLTCLAGGFQMKTDVILAGQSWTKGAPVSFDDGAVIPWAAGKQVLGFVGKDGYDAAKGQLHVIVTGGK